MLFWKYHQPDFEQLGALPPKKNHLPYGEQTKNSPFLSKDYATIWRAIENGYITQPSDCPPIRLISQFGYCIFCPGKVRLKRLETSIKYREFKKKSVKYGIAEISGDEWPNSDSGLVASWIAGSEFVKIQTGIDVLFPKSVNLYQGPLPNLNLLEQRNYEVMAGIEYYSNKKSIKLQDEDYGIANMNVIVRLPKLGVTLEINKGEPIGWFYPVFKSTTIKKID